MAAFKNNYYKKEWGTEVYVPGPENGEGDAEKHLAKNWDNTMGTYEYEKKVDAYAIYDGRTNFMGYVSKNGNFDPCGELYEVKASWLKAAKEALVAAGLVYGR